MATGTIKNQHKGTWAEVNTNLKYQVRSGIVFVWARASAASSSSWAVIGTLPTAVIPECDVFLTCFTGTTDSNFRINVSDGKVAFYGANTGATALFSYPLP